MVNGVNGAPPRGYIISEGDARAYGVGTYRWVKKIGIKTDTALLERYDPALPIGQLLISQRIAQAAVRRINSLTALVDGELEPKVDAGQKDRVALTVAQLRINQRIAQAAIRRADALAERIPDLPVPRPPENTASSDEIIGVAVAPRKVKILQVRRGPGTVGSTIALVLPPERRANNLFTGETVIAEGASAGTTFYAFYVSIEPGPNN